MIDKEQRAREYARMQPRITEMHRAQYDNRTEADFIAGWEAAEKQAQERPQT